MLDVIALIFSTIGAITMFVAAVGIVRFPDVFCRSHALAKGASMGIGFIFVGMALHLDSLSALFKVGLAAAFFVLTIPVSSHIFVRMAFREGMRPWRDSDRTDRSGWWKMG